MSRRVVRDAEWTIREYGSEKWPSVLREIENNDAPLEVAVNQVARPRSTRSRRTLIAGASLEVPSDIAFSGYLGWVASTTANASKDRDAIIELGSGWGRNLINAFLAGADATARYVAAEFTEAGRLATELLAKRRADFDLIAVPFDYHLLDWSLPRFRSATVVTVHSIEQIPVLSSSFVDFVRNLADDVTVLHFEPVGWQIRGDVSSDYAEQHDYNRNLWEVLTANDVDLQDVAVDVIGINPDNPTSLISWR